MDAIDKIKRAAINTKDEALEARLQYLLTARETLERDHNPNHYQLVRERYRLNVEKHLKMLQMAERDLKHLEDRHHHYEEHKAGIDAKIAKVREQLGNIKIESLKKKINMLDELIVENYDGEPTENDIQALRDFVR